MELLWKLINPNSNAPITGGAVGTSYKIRRGTDGYLFDFGDTTFKASGWTALTAALAEVDAANLPGVYRATCDTALWQDGEYQFDATYSAGGVLLYAVERVLIQDGVEAVTVGTNNDKTGYILTAAYDAAKAAATQTSVNALGSPMQVGTVVTVGTVNDKTGYALTAGEHTLISGTDVPAALTAQGLTTTRASYLDTLNDLVASIWSATTRTLSAFGFMPSLDSAYDAAKTAASQSSVTTIDGLVDAIKAKTDNLPADPASNTQVNTRLAATDYVAPANSDVAAIKAKTDNLPASPAATGDAMTLTTAYDAAKTAASQASVDTIDGLVDAIKAKTDTLPLQPASESAVLSRLSTADYVSPDNATIQATATDMDTALASLELLHANVAILTGGAGQYAVTVQLYRTGTTTPIADVSTSVHDSNGDVVGICQCSNAGGQCVFALNAGTYTARLLKSGYVFAVETMTVSADMTQTIYGEPVAIPAPADAESCLVYEYCFDQASALPLARVTATAAIVSLPYDYAGRVHEVAAIAGTYDATTGLVSWELVRGAIVSMKIKEVGVARRVTVPNATTARLSELR